MSDSQLSQDELDALLQGTPIESTANDSFSNAEELALSKLCTALGSARAAQLSELTGTTVTLEQATFTTGSSAKITEDLADQIIGSKNSLNGIVTGDWTIFAPSGTVLQVTGAMLNQENTEVSEEIIDTFTEVLNNALGSDIRILSEQLKNEISPTPGQVQSYTNGESLITAIGILVRISFVFNMNGATIPFYIVTPIKTAKNITDLLLPKPNTAQNTQQNANNSNQNGTVPLQAAQFQQFAPLSNVEPLDNLALLLDVPMRVTVELGRTRMTIKDILNLGAGSIIELEKLAGEPVDVLVNDKLIALGEVVIIDENFSVRVTKVVTPMERIFDRENLHGKGGV